MFEGGDPITWYARRHNVHKASPVPKPSRPKSKGLENPKLQFRSGEAGDEARKLVDLRPGKHNVHSARFSVAMEMMYLYFCTAVGPIYIQLN